jgi:flagellar biosynthesis protein FliP
VAISIAVTRNSGRMKDATQVLIWTSVNASKDCIGSADQLRNTAVQLQDVFHESLHQPRACDDQGDQHHQQTRQEAQRLFVELKTAFQIGFMIFIPFLIIDLVVASVLMAMGMMMLSPLIISLPFKIMLFVLVDGWALIIGTLAGSFGGV